MERRKGGGEEEKGKKGGGKKERGRGGPSHNRRVDALSRVYRFLGDLARMGKCMTSYQQQKLCMAPGILLWQVFGCPGHTKLSVFAVVRVHAQSGWHFCGQSQRSDSW